MAAFVRLAFVSVYSSGSRCSLSHDLIFSLPSCPRSFHLSLLVSYHSLTIPRNLFSRSDQVCVHEARENLVRRNSLCASAIIQLTPRTWRPARQTQTELHNR